jgi:hypothetical protein
MCQDSTQEEIKEGVALTYFKIMSSVVLVRIALKRAL